MLFLACCISLSGGYTGRRKNLHIDFMREKLKTNSEEYPLMLVLMISAERFQPWRIGVTMSRLENMAAKEFFIRNRRTKPEGVKIGCKKISRPEF